MTTNQIFKNIVIKTLLLGTLALNFYSCSEDNDNESAKNNSLSGVWEAKGYGILYEIDEEEENIIHYQITKNSAMKIDTYDLDFDGYEIDLQDQKFYFKEEGGITHLEFSKLDSLPQICKDNLVGETDDPLVNFDILWETFNDYYAFFELREINWETQKMELRERASVITYQNELWNLFEEILTPINDGHINLIDDEKEILGVEPKVIKENVYNEFEMQNETDEFMEFLNFKVIENFGILVEGYLGGEENIEVLGRGNIILGELSEETAYLSFEAMSGYAPNGVESIAREVFSLEIVLNEIIQALENYENLVIDIRRNPGGHDEISILLASYFADQKREIFSKKTPFGGDFYNEQTIFVTPKSRTFTKPIVLLTSEITASAAEVFTMSMREFPNVTLVGERTSGAISDQLDKVLPNGWEFSLSNEIYFSAQGEIFEKIGISPESENLVDFLSKEDSEDQKDSAIEKAIEILNN